MINNLTYEQILQVAATIKREQEIIIECTKGISLDELTDFISMMDVYSKYLNTFVKLNKDADEAIKNMV